MTILTLANSKGGGGKTTIAACLAAELTRRGKQVVLLDADPQQSLSVWHGNDGKLKELEIHTDASEKAAKWASEASKRAIVIVDTAGFASTTLAAILKVSDVVLIPCRASALDARGVMATHEMVQSTATNGVSVGCVLNAATRTALVSHIRNELISAGISVMGCEIGQRTVYAEAELAGSAPCWMGKPAIKAADEISALATELLPYLGDKPSKRKGK